MNRKAQGAAAHEHIFLGASHARNEKRTWAVIALCGTMMLIEIVGGLMFGSIALVADGLHMSTHAGALLLTALAYAFSRRHSQDSRFTFGTGKLGDLAGFASAIVLAMIALLIGYEAVVRFMSPVTIHFGEAIPIACLGLAVNLASAFLLGVDHDHGHHDDGHHDHGPHDHGHHDHGHHDHGHHENGRDVHSHLAAHAHEHHRDNNMRAAAIHVMADATVSVLVIVGLLLARWRGWLFMDPLAGLVGAFVIASWSYGLIRDTGAILLDMNPDRELSERIRQTIDGFGDQIGDLHLWRLGPGHLGAIVEVRTSTSRDADFYRSELQEFSLPFAPYCRGGEAAPMSNPPFWALLLIGLATGCATLAGGSLVLRFSSALELILGFSAGTLIGVALFDLLPEGLDLAGTHGQLNVTTAAAAGFLVYFAAERGSRILWTGGSTYRHFAPASLTLHSFLDGLGIGLAFHVSLAAGIIVALGVLAHDFLDGANTVAVSLSNGSATDEARLWLAADAAAPLAGILLAGALAIPAFWLAMLLGAFAGFFLYIGASDLLPRSQSQRPRLSTVAATSAGVALIYLLISLAWQRAA